MRASVLTFLGTIIISCLALTGCCTTNTCGTCGGCGGCEVVSPYNTECACTDPGVGRNNCMSRAKYCTVFGNAGNS